MTFPIYGIKFIFQTTICWRWCWSMERNYIWIFTDSRIVLVRGFEGYIQCTSKVMQRYCRLAIFWRMKVNSMYSRQNIVDSWCPSLFLISDQTVTQIFGVAGTTVHETPLLIFPWLKSDWNGLFFPEIPQTSIHRRCPIPIFAASYHVFFWGHPRSPMLLNPNARRNPRHISKRSRRVCWLPFPPVDATQCHEFGEDFLLNARNTSDFYGYKWGYHSINGVLTDL